MSLSDVTNIDNYIVGVYQFVGITSPTLTTVWRHPQWPPCSCALVSLTHIDHCLTSPTMTIVWHQTHWPLSDVTTLPIVWRHPHWLLSDVTHTDHCLTSPTLTILLHLVAVWHHPHEVANLATSKRNSRSLFLTTERHPVALCLNVNCCSCLFSPPIGLLAVSSVSLSVCMSVCLSVFRLSVTPSRRNNL